MLIILGFIGGAFILSQALAHTTKKDKWYLFFIWFALVFITGFRTLSFYTDTSIYEGYYNTSASRTFLKTFSLLLNWGENKDPFYHFTTGVLGRIGLSFRGWLIIISIIYYTGFICVVNRFSQIPFITVLGLTCLSYVFFTCTGIRQTIAMGFCFFAFIKAYDKKPIQFAIFIALASLYHSSAIIFILAYFFMRRKFGLLQIVVVVGSVTVAFLFPSAINQIVEMLAWNDDIEKYANVTTGLSLSGYIIQFAIVGGCFIVASDYCLHDEEGLAFFNMAILGLLFQIFAIRIDNIFRMSMYFSVYGLFLLSNSIAKMQKARDYWIVYGVVCAALLFQFLNSGGMSSFTLFGGV